MAKKDDLHSEFTTSNLHPIVPQFNFGKSWFLVDLYQINLFVAKFNSTTIVDSAIENIILNRIRQEIHLPEIYTQINLLNKLITARQNEVLDKIKKDSNLVWITLGTSISGCSLCNNTDISKAVDGRLVGIAGASPFNYGYSGLKLFIWDHEYFQKTKKKPQPLAYFYGGLSLIKKNNGSFA